MTVIGACPRLPVPVSRAMTAGGRPARPRRPGPGPPAEAWRTRLLDGMDRPRGIVLDVAPDRCGSASSMPWMPSWRPARTRSCLPSAPRTPAATPTERRTGRSPDSPLPPRSPLRVTRTGPRPRSRPAAGRHGARRGKWKRAAPGGPFNLTRDRPRERYFLNPAAARSSPALSVFSQVNVVAVTGLPSGPV